LLGSTDQGTDNMQNYNSSNPTQDIKTTHAGYNISTRSHQIKACGIADQHAGTHAC